MGFLRNMFTQSCVMFQKYFPNTGNQIKIESNIFNLKRCKKDHLPFMRLTAHYHPSVSKRRFLSFLPSLLCYKNDALESYYQNCWNYYIHSESNKLLEINSYEVCFEIQATIVKYFRETNP